MKQRWVAVILILLSLLAVLYPLISNFVNEKFRSEIRTEYFAAIENTDSGALETERRLAYEYNALLSGGVQEAYSDQQLNDAGTDYLSLLNLNGDSIMGYVEIPKLGIHLPILHGTDAQTLESGVGHVIGSSLPVGGTGTHAVLSAHSGMAREKMFSDLDQLDTGDVFFLHVLNETLAYEVAEINTVLPTDISLLGIEEESDLVTLVTCTPFGVNTHRLLVRGVRTEYTPAVAATASEEPEVPITSTWEQEYKKGLLWGLCALLALMILYLLLQKLPHKKAIILSQPEAEGILLETLLTNLYELRFEVDP